MVDLLRGKCSFSTEPLWYRLLIVLLQFLYLLLLTGVVKAGIQYPGLTERFFGLCHLFGK
jgi:hypothetical protein